MMKSDSPSLMRRVGSESPSDECSPRGRLEGLHQATFARVGDVPGAAEARHTLRGVQAHKGAHRPRGWGRLRLSGGLPSCPRGRSTPP